MGELRVVVNDQLKYYAELLTVSVGIFICANLWLYYIKSFLPEKISIFLPLIVSVLMVSLLYLFFRKKKQIFESYIHTKTREKYSDGLYSDEPAAPKVTHPKPNHRHISEKSIVPPIQTKLIGENEIAMKEDYDVIYF